MTGTSLMVMMMKMMKELLFVGQTFF